MEILVPTAPARDARKIAAGSLDTLDGKRIGIVSNGWRSMDAMVPRLTQRLKQRYGVSEVNLFKVHVNQPILADTLDKVVAGCDAAIVGLAN